MFKIGDKWFSGTVNIKNIKRGSLFTDVTKIKDVTKDIVNSYGESPKFHFLRTSSIDNVPQNPENVKRFSMKDAVEATDDLIAVHNLDRKDLEGALELGGFPMPSIAITKSDMGHTEFGDISVIFGRDTIDPAANKANNIYDSDNLENIIKAMKHQHKKGGSGGVVIAGTSTEEYGSIADIKTDKQRLRTIPHEKIEEMRAAFSARFREIAVLYGGAGYPIP